MSHDAGQVKAHARGTSYVPAILMGPKRSTWDGIAPGETVCVPDQWQDVCISSAIRLNQLGSVGASTREKAKVIPDWPGKPSTWTPDCKLPEWVMVAIMKASLDSIAQRWLGPEPWHGVKPIWAYSLDMDGLAIGARASHATSTTQMGPTSLESRSDDVGAKEQAKGRPWGRDGMGRRRFHGLADFGVRRLRSRTSTCRHVAIECWSPVEAREREEAEPQVSRAPTSTALAAIVAGRASGSLRSHRPAGKR
ncbi:hypothetical protein BS50DRAFT_660814 [Corynespora cassiicola Philippines]|uniref:Uncharacterized protein n=1 Tax=Corynespora cassiicola Philippines TaxID=1448308 RepID=A0A2T2P1M9_CORCC|nr:hypothetical protein BS50DRAFT_660814 [Corynespora cassiicola Philippines]